MTDSVKPIYGPALRMKAGELQGIRDLAADIADRTLPRMIVPPSAERDESLGPMLIECAEFPDISNALAAHWPGRSVLVEPTHLIDERGMDTVGRWLPKMFERAREARVKPIPLIQARDLLEIEAVVLRAAIDWTAHLQLGVVISSGDLSGHDILVRTLDRLADIGVQPRHALAIADFHDADLSDPTIVAPIISASLEYLQSNAQWQNIIFQGTNFPEANPAQPGTHCLIPRSEWIAWKDAVAFDPHTPEHFLFGDYAADCAKIAFGPSGGAAIRHYRYATPEFWLVQRGAAEGKNSEVMRAVCNEIVDSVHFAGREFSSADEYIFRTARRRAGPGNAKDWRAINTTHHITRVVTDIGTVRGLAFAKKAVEPLLVQPSLFYPS